MLTMREVLFKIERITSVYSCRAVCWISVIKREQTNKHICINCTETKGRIILHSEIEQHAYLVFYKQEWVTN